MSLRNEAQTEKFESNIAFRIFVKVEATKLHLWSLDVSEVVVCPLGKSWKMHLPECLPELTCRVGHKGHLVDFSKGDIRVQKMTENLFNKVIGK